MFGDRKDVFIIVKKRIIIFGIVVTISFIALIATVLASNTASLIAQVVQFRVFVNGEERTFENPIVTINDRTYIPLREISEVLGMDVVWDGENQKIIINNSQPPLPNDSEINPNEKNLETNDSQIPESYSNESEWDTLYAFEQDGLWGYKDAYSNVVIEPRFVRANRFSEGLAFVVDTEEQRGYIDLTGNLVIPLPTGRFASIFSQGFALIVLNDWSDGRKCPNDFFDGPFEFIDRTGKNVFGMEFLSARSFNSGFAIVQLLDETIARIDTEGNIVETGDWLIRAHR